MVSRLISEKKKFGESGNGERRLFRGEHRGCNQLVAGRCGRVGNRRAFLFRFRLLADT